MFHGVVPKGQPRTARSNAEAHLNPGSATNPMVSPLDTGYRDAAHAAEPKSHDSGRPKEPNPFA